MPGQVLPVLRVSVPAWLVAAIGAPFPGGFCSCYLRSLGRRATQVPVGEGVVPGQVLPIPGVSVPAVCAVRWDKPGAR